MHYDPAFHRNQRVISDFFSRDPDFGLSGLSTAKSIELVKACVAWAHSQPGQADTLYTLGYAEEPLSTAPAPQLLDYLTTQGINLSAAEHLLPDSRILQVALRFAYGLAKVLEAEKISLATANTHEIAEPIKITPLADESQDLPRRPDFGADKWPSLLPFLKPPEGAPVFM